MNLCSRTATIGLLFVDDLLIFSKGDSSSAMLIKQQLDLFSESFGLLANLDKSEIFFARVNEQVKNDIVEIVQMPLGVLPFRYFRVPLSHKKLTISQCVPFIDKISCRVRHWTGKFLSFAGKDILIQSVLTDMKGFWAKLFLLPKRILKKIQSICRNFLWSGTEDGSKKQLQLRMKYAKNVLLEEQV